jgi:hypothetical protein
MGLFSKRPDAKEVKVNWLQDIGPIYPNDDYIPHVLIHNPKTKKDGVWRLYFETLMGTGQGALKKISIYKDDKHISSKYYNLDNEDMSKEDALSDEEWGGEGWEDDADFSDWNHKS